MDLKEIDTDNLTIGERKIFREVVARGFSKDTALLRAVGPAKYRHMTGQTDTANPQVTEMALKESFKKDFIAEGKSPAIAERMAEVAASGRSLSRSGAGSADSLKESFKVDFLVQGYPPAVAEKMAEIAARGR